MNLGVPGHRTPAVGFEAPLEMLSACHARIEDQCATLRRLVDHAVVHGPDDAARTAAAAVIRYFETAGKLHHADEEENLFPALLESMAGSDPVCLRELTTSLTAEHDRLDACWRRVHTDLVRFLGASDGALDAAAVESMVTLYERHIEREESELLPMAARLLDDTVLDDIGRAMRERRGVALP